MVPGSWNLEETLPDHRGIALFVACLALLGGQTATANGAADSRLVLDLDGTTAAGETLTHLRAAFGETFSARIATLDEVVDQGFGPWTVPLPATLDVCPGTPLTSDELATGLADIESLMVHLEYGDALHLLAGLEARQCASVSPFTPEQLARLPFLRGVALFYSDELEAARSSFRRAVELHPDLAWDPDFPPDPQRLFRQAVGDAIRAPRQILDLEGLARTDALLLDGNPIQAGASEVQLIGDRHVLQLRDPDGGVTTVVLDLGGQERVPLFDTARMRGGLATSPDAEGSVLAFTLLVEAAHRQGHSDVLVLQRPLPELAWRFNDVDRTWSLTSLALRHELDRARQFRDRGGALLVGGLALAATGGIVALVHYDRAQTFFYENDMHRDRGAWELHIDELRDEYLPPAHAGVAILAAGGAVAVGGLVVTIHGLHTRHRALQESRVSLGFSTTGGGAGTLTVSF